MTSNSQTLFNRFVTVRATVNRNSVINPAPRAILIRVNVNNVTINVFFFFPSIHSSVARNKNKLPTTYFHCWDERLDSIHFSHFFFEILFYNVRHCCTMTHFRYVNNNSIWSDPRRLALWDKHRTHKSSWNSLSRSKTMWRNMKLTSKCDTHTLARVLDRRQRRCYPFHILRRKKMNVINMCWTASCIDKHRIKFNA